MSHVKTSRVKDRRALRFGRLRELVDDIGSFGGTVRATGNWTPAQIVEHVAKFIECSLDGFPVRDAPLILRGVAKMMRSSILNKPMSAGFKSPRKLSAMLPSPDVTWDQAVARLKKVVDRIDGKGERMVQRSPLLGFLEHEEWIQLHCRHAEMHFSFLKAVEVDT
jgi:hypothetical protein